MTKAGTKKATKPKAKVPPAYNHDSDVTGTALGIGRAEYDRAIGVLIGFYNESATKSMVVNALEVVIVDDVAVRRLALMFTVDGLEHWAEAVGASDPRPKA